MATVTNPNPIENIWPPQALSGGTITVSTATNMTYISEAGFTITLRGTGFTYDEDGLGSGGTIGRVIISKDGLTHAEYTGVSVNLTQASMLLFGYERDHGNFQNPQPYDFLQLLLRADDVITGSAGRDDLRGGYGNDSINAGAGYDYVTSESGADTMDGGSDRDSLSFDEANNSFGAYRGVDLDAALGTATDAWGFTDTFSNFERYVDTLFSDTLRGSDLDEEFTVSRGVDVVDGRGGFDWLDYGNSLNYGGARGVRVNLVSGVAVDSWRNSDSITNIEAVRGTNFNDTLIGNSAGNWFETGDGSDDVTGGGGEDWLVFWSVGNDGTGHGVTINLTAAANVIDDGYGNAENASGIEVFIGSRLDDRMTGNTAANHFGGQEGNDTLNGGGGADDVHGDDGRDVVIGGTGNDQVHGGADDDTLTGGTGADLFNFFEFDSRMGRDVITDFAVGVDRIRVTGDFGGFSDSDLVAAQFRSGAGFTAATTAAHRLIYNTTTGDLYLDRDGQGGNAAVLFAHLDNRAALTFNDIQIEF